MSEITLTAEERTEFGKGHSRRARLAGKIPAVLYGHGKAPVHLELPAREYAQAIKHGINALLSVEIGSKKSLALTKAIQRDPIKRTINHVDLLLVRRGEKVEIELPIVLVGEGAKGGLLNQELTTLTVEAEATHIPESVEVSLDGLEVGGQILASDVTLPKGTTLITEGDATVVGLMAAPTAADLEGDSGSAEAAAADAGEETPEA